jgi:nucleoside-diphosphate-sugar epimerase
MSLTVLVTGASGFLGQTLLEVAGVTFPNATLLPLHSPRHGGIDLTQSEAMDTLQTTIHITYPQDTILVHAAAMVDWETPDALFANAAMAVNVAMWAKSTKIGFCILVSTVNVYETLPYADTSTPCLPPTFYGLGKLVAEHIWRLLLPSEHSAIIRLAGIWGWQRRPTLFWNRLLLAAGRGTPPEPKPVVRRSRSRRNYISAREASCCLLQIGTKRMSGMFLGAGRDVTDTQSLVKALQDLPGSKLSVDWQDDGGADDVIYRPSDALLPSLKPFPEELSTCWANRPDWAQQGL